MAVSFKWGEFSEKGLYSIANCNRRINFWEGSVRSSKTICSLVAWIQFVSEAPPGDLLIFGKTERTVKRNILGPLKDMLGKQFDFKIGSGEATMLGRKILIVGANDERAEAKIRGGTFAGALGDEGSLIPESFIKMLLTRLSVDGARLFLTTNPDSPYHYLKTELIDNSDIDIIVFHFELDDNPNISDTYKDNIKKEFVGLWYKRFILGLWVMAEGAIYDMWDDEIHLKKAPEDLDQYKKIWASIDYGTSNPCTFGIYGLLELEKEEGGEEKEEDPEDQYEIYKLAEYWYDSKES